MTAAKKNTKNSKIDLHHLSKPPRPASHLALEALGIGKFTMQVELVTPEMAKEFLSRSIDRQRAVREKHVSALSTALASKDWVFAGDPMRFDVDGVFMDGQHRAMAIVRSGVTVPCVIMRGLPKEAFRVIDMGAKRTPADILKIDGYDYCTGIAAAIRGILALRGVEAGAIAGTNVAKTVMTNAALLSCAEEYGDALEDLTRLMTSKPARQICCPTGMFTALHFMFMEKSAPSATAFFNTLIMGDEFEFGRNDPIYQLRNALISNRTSKHKKRPIHYVVAIAIKAWNLYMERRDVNMLQFRENEDWPKISTRRHRVSAEKAAEKSAKPTKRATAKSSTADRS